VVRASIPKQRRRYRPQIYDPAPDDVISEYEYVQFEVLRLAQHIGRTTAPELLNLTSDEWLQHIARNEVLVLDEDDRKLLARWLDSLATYPRILSALGEERRGQRRSERGFWIAFHILLRRQRHLRKGAISHVAGFWSVAEGTAKDALTAHRRAAESRLDIYLRDGQAQGYSAEEILAGLEEDAIPQALRKVRREHANRKATSRRKSPRIIPTPTKRS
jgi:hypothetical protein